MCHGLFDPKRAPDVSLQANSEGLRPLGIRHILILSFGCWPDVLAPLCKWIDMCTLFRSIAMYWDMERTQSNGHNRTSLE